MTKRLAIYVEDDIPPAAAASNSHPAIRAVQAATEPPTEQPETGADQAEIPDQAPTKPRPGHPTCSPTTGSVTNRANYKIGFRPSS